MIEIDGATHGTDAEIAHDARRDAYLKERGWTTIRFTNDDVFSGLDSVVDAILSYVPPPSASPTPPP